MAAFLGIWEFIAGRYVDPYVLSGPTEVVKRLWEWLQSGLLLHHLGYTLQEIAVGFLIGAVAGLLLGFLMGEYPALGQNLEPYVLAIYGIPRTALAPLFILWFGIGLVSKVAQAALMVFFMVFFNTYAGLRNVDTELLDVVRMMGATRRQLITKVKLPAALPFLMTGLKVSVPQAFIGAVVAEFISSNRGIGYLIVYTTAQFDTAGTFAGILVLMVVVYLLNSLLARVEQRVVYRHRPVATTEA